MIYESRSLLRIGSAISVIAYVVFSVWQEKSGLINLDTVGINLGGDVLMYISYGVPVALAILLIFNLFPRVSSFVLLAYFLYLIVGMGIPTEVSFEHLASLIFLVIAMGVLEDI